MSTEDNNKLKYNHREKSLKAPFAIYADLGCLLMKQQFFKIIVSNLILKEKLCMSLRGTH